MAKHIVISSCRSARRICGGIEYDDGSDIVARGNQQSYFEEQDKEGHSAEVRRVERPMSFSRMTSTSSAGED